MIWRTRTLGPSLALAVLSLSAAGCSVSTHAEWHAGTSSGNSGNEPPPSEPEHHHTHHGRHSDAGRDHVVRVTRTDKSANGGDGNADSGGEREVVHTTGPAPANAVSSGDPASSGAGESGSPSSGGSSSGGDGASGGSAPTESASGAGETSSDSGSSEGSAAPGKNTLKHENEPHIARPVKRARAGSKGEGREEGSGGKGGRRE